MRERLSGFRKDERGFTLIELLTTVAILGILLAIAIIILLGLLERWRVDAAAKQLAADLRLAHSNATNQLTDWRVVVTPGSPDYSLVKLQAPYGGGATVPPTVETIQRSLPKGTKVFSTTANPSSSSPAVEFNSDGTIYVVNGPNGHVMVSSSDEDPQRKVKYQSATSRIEIDP